MAISSVVLPHALDDISSFPAGHICRIEGKGCLSSKRLCSTAFLTIPSPPRLFLDFSFNVKVSSGPKFQVTVEHSDTHQLTIAGLGNNKVRLSVSLSKSPTLKKALIFLSVWPAISVRKTR